MWKAVIKLVLFGVACLMDILTILNILCLLSPIIDSISRSSKWFAPILGIFITILVMFVVIVHTDLNIPHEVCRTFLLISVILLMVFACITDAIAAHNHIARGSSAYILMSLPGLLPIGASIVLSLSKLL